LMVSARPRQLSDLRSPEIGERLGERSVIVQPIGAIEQHGPHLPLSTDVLVPEAVIDAVAADRGDELDLWVLPTLVYTKSNEHAWSAGTVWLSAATMLSVLDDIGRSLAMLPSKRVAFFNGHGGNSSLLNVALRELRLSHGLDTFLLHPMVPRDQGGKGGDAAELGMGVHAGLDETSLVLHLRPDLVDMALAERHVPEHLASNEHVRFGGTASFGWLSNDFGPAGVIGDPTGATPERGKALFEAMVVSTGDALAEVSGFRF
jgi:creatinine amidohydrolase